MANYGTGITIECPCCGATDVPVKWGGDDGDMRTRVHAVGKPFNQNYYAGKCYGPVDVMTHMLRESRLANAGAGKRIMTTAEELATGVNVEPGKALACGYEDADMGLANG